MKLPVTLLLLFLSINACEKYRNSTVETLGGPIPTYTPLIFAQGVVSQGGYVEGSLVFSPDMMELFFQRRKPEESHNIYTMRFVKGRWTQPEPAFFSTHKEYLDFHPRFSPDGNRLYFGSTRPLEKEMDSLDMQRWKRTPNGAKLHQWYIEKSENGWKQPVLLLEKLFEDEWIMCVTPSENGNLYFTSKEKEDQLEDEGIYYATNQKGRYPSIERLPQGINAEGKWRAHPFVAPDESYLLYDAERTSIPDNGDLYISFNQGGIWTESVGLGRTINTKLSETGATVSPDGKYLFFNRGEERQKEDGSSYWDVDMYWVDFIRLKEKILKNMN